MKIKSKTLFSIALLIVLLIVFALKFLAAQNANAAWFDDAWTYRKKINIASHTTSENNVYVVTPTFDATDTNRFSSSCGNIRFTKENGEVLPYFVVACTASASMHVFFDTLPAGETNYYMYYGNVNAESGATSTDFATLAGSLGSQTLGSESLGNGPVMYYKFDDAGGTSASDSTLFANTGTLGGTTKPTWQTSDQCISGTCLYFEGSTAKVTGSKIAKAIKSISFWIRPNTIATQGIINLDGGTHTINTDSSGKITANGFTSPSYYLNGVSVTTLTLVQNQWNFVEITTGTSFDTTSSFTIGTDGTNFIKGFIDGVKFYNYARSATQDEAGYSGAGTTKGVTAAFGYQSTSFLNNNLVGYWNTDEASGTSAGDSSGNTNTGTLTNMQETGTADASGGSTSTLKDTTSSSLAATDNVYNGAKLVIKVTCGANTAGFEKSITAYNHTTKVITVGSAFPATLNSCQYEIRHDVSTKFGNGLIFDGINDYTDAGNGTTLQITGNLTVSAWISLTNTSSIHDIVSKDGASGQFGYRLYVDASGKLNFEVSSDGTLTTTATGTTTLSSATLYHVVGIYNPGSSVTVYVNGVQDATNTTSIPASIKNSTANLEIGAENGGTTNFMSGKIDDARIYSRVLSASEILYLNNWAPGPFAYWKFDEGTGTTVNDSSGNANTGTWSGSGTTHWVPGKIGSAGNYDGTSDRVTSSNGNSVKGLHAVTLSMWVYPTSYNSNGGEVYFEPTNGSTSNTRFELVINSSGTVNFDGRATGADSGSDTNWVVTTGTVALNQWSFLSATYTDTAQQVCINGKCESGAVSLGGFANINPGAVPDIGAESDVDTFDQAGRIDDVKLYNYVRSQQQIIEDMNGGHPTSGSPIGSQMIYWKLDEDYGTTANNSISTQSSLTGTTSGTTWLTNATCKYNGCLSFTGSTNSVSAGDVAFVDGLTGFSTSFWINPQTLAVDKSIISKNNTSQKSFAVVTDHTDSSELRVHFAASTGEADNTTYCTTPTGTLVASAWEQITVVYDGTQGTAGSRVSVYKNGVKITCTATGTFPASMTSGSTSNLKLGDDDSSTYSALVAYLDDIKIYNSALTLSQVLVDYNANSAINYGTGKLESANLSDGTGNAPSLYWNFEEGTGGNTNDVSGNTLTGTVTTVSAVTGKVGGALSLTATGSNISAGDVAFVDGLAGLSVNFWINPQSLATNKMILSKANNTTQRVFQIKTDDTTSTELKVMISSSASDTSNFCITSNLGLGTLTWQYISVVYDGSQATGDNNRVKVYKNGVLATCPVTGTIPTTLTSGTTSNLKAGQGDDTTPTSVIGYIDELKIYNYVRTPAQVAYDYNRGRPIGLWRFDECQAATAHDASGNSFDATLTVGASGTQTAIGTCTTSSTAWGNGATGKFNASLNLDGNDDFLTTSAFSPLAAAGLSNTAVSWGGWFFPTHAATAETLIDKPSEFHVIKNTSDQIACGFGSIGAGNDGANVAITLSAWNHIFCTYDGSNVKTYINGILKDTTAISTSITATSSILYLGEKNDGTQRYQGQIDGTRLYNYALSATQLKLIYNNDAEVRFGPTTGAP